jgi:hypothetical protein
MQTITVDTIYLDIDDVCNTFTMYVLNFLGASVSQTNYREHPATPGYGIVAEANKLLGENFTDEYFWSRIPRYVWANCPESEEYRQLLDACFACVGTNNVFFATKPTNDPNCAAGKVEWIQNHSPQWMRSHYFLTPYKHHLSRAGVLLIDDRDRNCQQFREYGGEAIMMPRPWNNCRDLSWKVCVIGRLRQLEYLTSGRKAAQSEETVTFD